MNTWAWLILLPKARYVRLSDRPGGPCSNFLIEDFTSFAIL